MSANNRINADLLQRRFAPLPQAGYAGRLEGLFMFDDPKKRAAAEDAFARVDDNIPLDQELRSMTYLALCELLSSCQSGTTKHSIVEREKTRRDIIENAKLSQPSKSFWYHPSMGVVLSVVAAIIAAALLAFFGFK